MAVLKLYPSVGLKAEPFAVLVLVVDSSVVEQEDPFVEDLGDPLVDLKDASFEIKEMVKDLKRKENY